MEFPLIHHLAYSWAGWPSEGVFPSEPAADFFVPLRVAWRTDGLDLLTCV